MEPYIAADPVWGWLGTLYLSIPVLCLFALLILGSVGAPHVSNSLKKLALYPILKVIRKGAQKVLLVTGKET